MLYSYGKYSLIAYSFFKEKEKERVESWGSVEGLEGVRRGEIRVYYIKTLIKMQTRENAINK